MTRTILLMLAMVSMALAADSIKYSYDAAGRLTRADYGDGRVIVYSYDPAGNLLRRTVSTTGVPEQSTKKPAARKVKAAVR